MKLLSSCIGCDTIYEENQSRCRGIALVCNSNIGDECRNGNGLYGNDGTAVGHQPFAPFHIDRLTCMPIPD